MVAEADNETAEAATRLAAAPGTDIDADRASSATLVEPIIQRGATRGLQRGAGRRRSGRRQPDRRRRRAVHAGPRHRRASRTRWRSTSTSSRRPPGPTPTSAPPDEATGAARRPRHRGRLARSRCPADGDTYTLYYLFPLDEEQETLALVTRALLTAGVLLLLLVAGLTWLVTRQVVTPIRMARRVAERLAAGQLQERLRVTGEDDLARLATSFNQMASNLQRQIRQLEELSRVQRRFVSDVSHELRTPLTTVRMAGDVLHDARARLRPGHRRAPPSCCRPSSTGSRRCWSTCSRSAASTPAPPCSTSTTSTSSTSPTGSST